MAVDLGKVDYSQYASWPQVKTPSGGTYYEVPGTAYVYDPFLSAAKNRTQLFINPKQKLTLQQQALDEHNSQVKLAKQQSSPGGQLVAQAAPAVGTLAALYGAKQIAGSPAQTGADKLLEAQANALNAHTSALSGGNPAAVAQTPVAAPTTSAQAFANGGAAPVINPSVTGSDPLVYGQFSGPAPTGAPTTIPTAAPTISPPIGTDGITQLDVTGVPSAAPVDPSAQVGGTGLIAQAPGSTLAGSETLGAFLPALGIAAGAYTGAQQLKGLQQAYHGGKLDFKEQAALALPTFGASLLFNHVPGLTHVSTKETEAKNWGGLADQHVTGAAQAFAMNHPEGDTGVWQTGPNAGKKWNFDDALAQAKTDPTQFAQVYGNYKTFGNDWNTYTPQQQTAITKGIIDAGLYNSKKGDIHISDEDAARTIKDKVLAGVNTLPAPTGQTPGQQRAPQPGAPVIHKLQPDPIAPATAQDLGKQLAARWNARVK